MDQRQEIETPYHLEARVDQVWQNLNLLATEVKVASQCIWDASNKLTFTDSAAVSK